MLIEAVFDPVIEQGWHMHHKHMVLDKDFLNWGPARHVHNKILQTCFMLKPFILDMSSPAYEKNML